MLEILEHLHACEAFRSLSPWQVRELATDAVVNCIPKDKDVFTPGDKTDSVYVLASGTAQITHTDPSGKRAILQVVGPGKLFGQCALIDVHQREARCSATVNSTLITLPVKSLKKLMMENPQLASDLMMNVGDIMRSLAHRLASVLLRPKRQRLLDVLWNLAASDGIKSDRAILIPQVFSHQELGEMIGSSRETVTITLGQLKSEGIVAFKGRQIILLLQTGADAETQKLSHQP